MPRRWRCSFGAPGRLVQLPPAAPPICPTTCSGPVTCSITCWLLERSSRLARSPTAGRPIGAHLLAGLAMIAAAVGVELVSPQTAAVLAALGNAAFHVGAGAIVLSASPKRTVDAGVFVGPGAVGPGNRHLDGAVDGPWAVDFPWPAGRVGCHRPGDLIQLAKPFRLGAVLADEQGVQVLQVGKAHELRNVRIVADIAFPARILSRQSFAVMPKSAMFSTSASVA